MLLTVLGLMSGTSLDGVDVALIRTDGERVEDLGPSAYRRYSESERAVLRQALADAVSLNDRTARPGHLGEAERLITRAHAEAVRQFMSTHDLQADQIDLVGFHGQTVLHRPADRLTVQIGDGAELAAMLGIPVVYDLRAADVAAGGQGAPLVPVFHKALVERLSADGPTIVVNIGGVSNITYVGSGGELIACDTGPGNALLDDFVLQMHRVPFDDGGRLAAQGSIDQAWLASALVHPFFQVPPPKSLDRNSFAALPISALTLETGAATLTAFTAASIAAIASHLPEAPERWIVAGGGARNATLMRMLGERLALARVLTADDCGWSADAMEAYAFGFLAARSINGLPITFPGTTGVGSAMTGGVLAGTLER